MGMSILTRELLLFVQFLAPRWQNQYMPDGETVGNTVLRNRALPTDPLWIPVGAAIIIFAILVFNTGAWLTHAFLNRESLAQSALTARHRPSFCTWQVARSRCVYVALQLGFWELNRM